MDHQGSPEPETGPSEDDEEEEVDGEKGSKGVSAAPSRLFNFSMVNSYGTANISPLPCDGNVLKLNRESPLCLLPLPVSHLKESPVGLTHSTRSSSLPAAHSTVAIDWDPDTRKRCYDDQEAEVSVIEALYEMSAPIVGL